MESSLQQHNALLVWFRVGLISVLVWFGSSAFCRQDPGTQLPLKSKAKLDNATLLTQDQLKHNRGPSENRKLFMIRELRYRKAAAIHPASSCSHGDSVVSWWLDWELLLRWRHYMSTFISITICNVTDLTILKKHARRWNSTRTNCSGNQNRLKVLFG